MNRLRKVFVVDAVATVYAASGAVAAASVAVAAAANETVSLLA